MSGHRGVPNLQLGPNARHGASCFTYLSPTLELLHFRSEQLPLLLHCDFLAALLVLLLLQRLLMVPHQLLDSHSLLLLLLQAHGQQCPQLSDRVRVANAIRRSNAALGTEGLDSWGDARAAHS